MSKKLKRPEGLGDFFTTDWTPIAFDPLVYRFTLFSDGWWYQIGMTEPNGDIVLVHLSCIQGVSGQAIRTRIYDAVYRIEEAKELWIRTFTTWRE